MVSIVAAGAAGLISAPIVATAAVVIGVAGAVYGAGRLIWDGLENVSYNFQQMNPGR